ncbi:MAG: NTP transferase domain-containing protein [Acidobacteria bacterium]|nr:NTP transferase domain-containing protein [Acidobacteriota bacterium]
MSEIVGIATAWGDRADRARGGALATVIRTRGSTFRRPGARMLVFEDGSTIGSVSGGCLENSVIDASSEVIRTGRSVILRYDGADDDVLLGEGAMCDGEVAIAVEKIGGRLSDELATIPDAIRDRDLFLTVSDEPESGPRTRIHLDEAPDGASGRVIFRERLQAPLELILCGGGALAASMARLAVPIGWEPVVVDHRPRVRESMAALARTAKDLGPVVTRPARTAIVVMTHHFERDLDLVAEALANDPLYVGLIGSRSRSGKLVAELRNQHGDLDLFRLHTPAGLEIGSETVEEIALSIVAEIQAVRRGVEGGSLSASSEPVHGRGSARLAAIILAAGGSSRMGESKLLMKGRGDDSLLEEALATVGELPVCDVVVVDGAEPEVGAIARRRGARSVPNSDWREGIASSVRCGVAALGDDIDAALIVLADQPRIDRPDLERLIGAWRADDRNIVATRYAQGGGVPAIFARSLFRELMRLDGDEGARELIRSDSTARLIEAGDTRDVDDPRAYAEIVTDRD